MKKTSFTIPFYNFDITLVQVDSKDDAEPVRRLLKAFGVRREDADDVVDGIRRGAVNGGETFREMRQKKMLVIFYLFDSKEKKAEVYSHEKRHVEDRLLEWNGVNDIESAGMLAGWLGVRFRRFEG